MILSFLLLACGTAENPFVHLQDVANPNLVVNAGDVPPAGPRLQVLVHPEISGVCRELPDLRADIDGVALTRLHGKYDDGKYAYDRDCNVYEFVADAALLAKLPPRPDNVVTVSDSTAALTLTATGLFAKPTLTAPTEPVAAGSVVTLPWTPGGDVVDPSVPVTVWLTPEGAERVPAKDVKSTGESVAFTLPEGVTGAVEVNLTGTAAFTPKVTACTGAKTCAASRAFLLDPLKIVVN